MALTTSQPAQRSPATHFPPYPPHDLSRSRPPPLCFHAHRFLTKTPTFFRRFHWLLTLDLSAPLYIPPPLPQHCHRPAQPHPRLRHDNLPPCLFLVCLHYALLLRLRPQGSLSLPGLFTFSLPLFRLRLGSSTPLFL